MDIARSNVLISSAGRRVGLVRAFQAAYTRLGISGRVYACDASRLSAACWVSDGFDLVPRCDDPNFVDAVLDICKRRDVGVIVPTIDPELPVYAEAAGRLADARVQVLVSAPEVVSIGADKVRTHEWLVRNGFPTVGQQKCAAEFLDEVRFPAIAKPRFGSASLGVRRVASADEALALVGDSDYILQEIAPGVEFTVDALALGQLQPIVCVPRRRIEVRAGEVSKAVTCRHPSLQALVRRIVQALPGAYGVLNVQVFLDASTGRMSVIEINPRFGGGFPLSWAAGADFPRWLLEHCLGQPVSVVDDQWEDGLTMLRFDDAAYVRGVGV